MHFRSILSGTLAIFLLFGASAHARDGSGLSIEIPKIGLPGVFGSKSDQGTVQLAQAGDPRVTALEEQIRKLNGSIEELNFQLLQMQEQMRKMQEDNEFRFQELEGSGGQKKSDASGKTNNSIVEAPVAPQPGTSHQQTASAPAAPAAGGQSVEDVIVESGTGDPGTTVPGGNGAPPTTFGTITVDKNGNVVSSTTDEHPTAAPLPKAQPTAPAAAPSAPKVASLPSTNDPDEIYRNSYQFVLSGDYTTAEQGFRDHIARFPADPKTADARFWLGESLLGQKKYRDAAEIFLNASKEYPKSKKAPEMMLKLGVSLVGLKQREVACATFSEISKRYPDISGALKERVKQERTAAAC
ncbi:MAG: tol-pal system protein YbgF [Proteobacteria bacterium]|nr:tol-pal system protein YbgF [Pseudomonadota bacterium]